MILEKHCGAVVIILLSASTIIALANYLHVSVSLAEIGFSCTHAGIKTTAQNNHVRTIPKLWPAYPLTTAVTSFSIPWSIKAFLPL